MNKHIKIFREDENIPMLELRVEWNYMLKTYPSGKIVKVFYDKRKKDQIVKEGEEV